MPKPRKWSSSRRARVLADRRKTNAIRLAEAVLTAQRDNPKIRVSVDRETLIDLVYRAMERGETAAVASFAKQGVAAQ